MTKKDAIFCWTMLSIVAFGAPLGLLGIGCATQTYTNKQPDGSIERYTFRESTLPGMKVDARRGDVHTEISPDGGSLFEMGRSEEGLDTTSQLDAIVSIANLVAGARNGPPSAVGGVLLGTGVPARAPSRAPAANTPPALAIPPFLLEMDAEGNVDPDSPALINSIIRQLNSNTGTQQEIIDLINDLTAQVGRLAITNELGINIEAEGVSVDVTNEDP